MKKKYAVLLTLGLSVFVAHQAYTNAGGAPSGNSGSPASNNNTCARAGCHNGPAAAGQSISINTNIPTAGFKEDSVYQISITADNNAASSDRMGFMASVESASGHEGSITITDAARTKKAGSYITHTSSGISGTAGTNSWSFDWDAGQAPDQTTVYVAVNFTNLNGSTSGDVIVTQTLSLDKNLGIGQEELAVQKLAAYPNPAQNEITLASGQPLEAPFTAIAADGKMVELQAEADNHQHVRLDLSALPAGLYMIRDAQGHQVQISKL
ncbi:choice-of-anchor V domain-containing protein [Croceimicrobium sp.]|uniref:choice-of-anchor V domain-containing protein n=1 Tax=Croceimicrobium sp. TaxID=2828340 RepID=UPI003BAB2656